MDWFTDPANEARRRSQDLLTDLAKLIKQGATPLETYEWLLGDLRLALLWYEQDVLGDLAALLRQNETDARIREATRRLAGHFSLGLIFAEPRRRLVADAFRRKWLDEGKGQTDWQTDWQNLVVAFVLIALRKVDVTTTPELLQRIRNTLRAEIERELFGRTLDSGDVAKRLQTKGADPQDALEAAVTRMDLLIVLGQEKAALLLAYYGEYANDKAWLAKQLGITEATLRKRVERASQKLREAWR